MSYCLSHIQTRIAACDQNALAELYRLLNRKLHHFSKLITRSSELSEEVVEDVFVKLWCNRQKIMDIENLHVYLYVAVKNQSLTCIAAKAKELVKAPFEDLEINIGHIAADPYDLLITAEMMQQMQQAVDDLPPRCKMIFKLVREDGLKYKEVAEILNITVNTIDAQMAIAVKKICTALHIAKPKAGNTQFNKDHLTVGKK
jgi:RNA polymerase sigma-70 factor (ECF subfamily)